MSPAVSILSEAPIMNGPLHIAAIQTVTIPPQVLNYQRANLRIPHLARIGRKCCTEGWFCCISECPRGFDAENRANNAQRDKEGLAAKLVGPKSSVPTRTPALEHKLAQKTTAPYGAVEFGDRCSAD